MTRPRSRWLAPLALGVSLAIAQAPTPVFAQEEVPVEGGESKGGRPFDGYFATGLLAGLVLFIVGKSARR